LTNASKIDEKFKLILRFSLYYPLMLTSYDDEKQPVSHQPLVPKKGQGCVLFLDWDSTLVVDHSQFLDIDKIRQIMQLACAAKFDVYIVTARPEARITYNLIKRTLDSLKISLPDIAIHPVLPVKVFLNRWGGWNSDLMGDGLEVPQKKSARIKQIKKQYPDDQYFLFVDDEPENVKAVRKHTPSMLANPETLEHLDLILKRMTQVIIDQEQALEDQSEARPLIVDAVILKLNKCLTYLPSKPAGIQSLQRSLKEAKYNFTTIFNDTLHHADRSAHLSWRLWPECLGGRNIDVNEFYSILRTWLNLKKAEDLEPLNRSLQIFLDKLSAKEKLHFNPYGHGRSQLQNPIKNPHS
jgi:hypothetical protein